MPAVLRAQRDTTPEARAPLNELLRDENDDLARESARTTSGTDVFSREGVLLD